MFWGLYLQGQLGGADSRYGLPYSSSLAHMAGVFGKRGMLKLMSLSAEVDRLLSNNQEEILKTFACCIIPPKDLSDPVRAGQATSGEKEIEILRKVRKVPGTSWPYAKRFGLKKLEQLLVFKYPGITGDRIKSICTGVGEIYEKARKLPDVDFELEKGKLAAENGYIQSTNLPHETIGNYKFKRGTDDR